MKTHYNDQATVQPTESSVYSAIVKGLMEKYRISQVQAKAK